MSTLLDALKKSERERSQQPVPVYNTMQPPEEKSSLGQLLVILVIVAVIIVLIAGIYFLFSQHTATQEQPQLSVAEAVEYSTLPPQEQDYLRDLRINVVSVSQQPGRSFVILGEQLYRVGDTVAEDVQLQAIGKDFVVFDWNGKQIKRGLE